MRPNLFLVRRLEGGTFMNRDGSISADAAEKAAGGRPDEDRDETDLMWTPVQVRHLVNDEWIDFREVEYRMPDGTTYRPFYSYSRRDYVVVVATDEEGRYLTVRQFRHGIRCVTNEFVAGGIEGTDRPDFRHPASPNASDEQALAAAKRELMEESGFESDEWSHVLTVPSNATVADNYAYIFRARNCRRVAGQSLDDTEFLNVHLKTKKELEEMISGGQFQQAIHVMAFCLTEERGFE